MITKDMDEQFEREKLHSAAQEGDLAEVNRLVEEGYDVNAFDDDLPLTPLHYAVREGHLEVAGYLLSVGADVNAHDESRIGETPLGEVAGNCSFEIASLLIQHGANPSIPGGMQRTALHRAKLRKKPEGKKVYELLRRASRGEFRMKYGK